LALPGDGLVERKGRLWHECHRVEDRALVERHLPGRRTMRRRKPPWLCRLADMLENTGDRGHLGLPGNTHLGPAMHADHRKDFVDPGQEPGPEIASRAAA